MSKRPLTIFIAHCSDLLTDHRPHGDGLIAHGFISSLARRGHTIHVAAQEADLRNPLPPNVVLHIVRTTATRGPLARLEYMVRMRLLLVSLRRTVAFDLVHQLNPVFTGLSLALAGCGLPLVLGTYVARWPADAEPGQASSLKSRLISAGKSAGRSAIAYLQQRQADTLLLTTPAAMNRLPRPEGLRARQYTLPHGVDTELFSPRADWENAASQAAEQASLSVLFFANVWKRKGIFTLLDAFETVARAVPGVRLTVAGGGPELAAAQARAEALPCSAQIEFLGTKQRAEAPELYRNCSVYCLPSFGEPYATTVLEAMSCAKPLVVTDAGGLPYMVHPEGGRRVAAGDAHALARALIELLQSPEERMAMGRYNRALVTGTMTWERVAARLEGIYCETLKLSSSPQQAKSQSTSTESAWGHQL